MPQYDVNPDKLVREARTFIGHRFGPYECSVDPKCLRTFAHAIGETRPEFLETKAAQQLGWRDIPALPTYLFCLQMLSSTSPMAWAAEMGFSLDRLLHVEQSFIYHQPIFAGDQLHCEIVINNVFARRGGELIFVECTLIGHSVDGQLMATATELLAQTTSRETTKW
jgi:hypothetical protein